MCRCKNRGEPAEPPSARAGQHLQQTQSADSKINSRREERGAGGPPAGRCGAVWGEGPQGRGDPQTSLPRECWTAPPGSARRTRAPGPRLPLVTRPGLCAPLRTGQGSRSWCPLPGDTAHKPSSPASLPRADAGRTLLPPDQAKEGNKPSAKDDLELIRVLLGSRTLRKLYGGLAQAARGFTDKGKQCESP